METLIEFPSGPKAPRDGALATLVNTYPKTRVDALLKAWRDRGGTIRFSDAQHAYCGTTVSRPRIGWNSDKYKRTGMTVVKVLRKYGIKMGVPGTHAGWKLNDAFCVTYLTKVVDIQGNITDVYDIPSGLEPTGIVPPATMPHLMTKSPLLLSMESAVEVARQAMLRAQHDYARALEECNERVKFERALIWAREQVAGITDPTVLRALVQACSVHPNGESRTK